MFPPTEQSRQMMAPPGPMTGGLDPRSTAPSFRDFFSNKYPESNKNPLVISHMENHHAIHGKSTMSMVIFDSYVTNYQKVQRIIPWIVIFLHGAELDMQKKTTVLCLDLI